MGTIDQIVNVSIQVKDPRLTQVGFGTPLILIPEPGISAQVGPVVMDRDGLAGLSAGVRAWVDSVFTQEREPATIKAMIFPAEAQSFTLTVDAARCTPYQKLAVWFTSSDLSPERRNTTITINSKSAAAVATDLATALTSDLATFATVTDNSDGTITIDWLTDTPVSVECPTGQVMIEETTPAPSGLDLDAAAVVDPDFYGLAMFYGGAAATASTAAWSEVNGRLFLAKLGGPAADAASVPSGTLDHTGWVHVPTNSASPLDLGALASMLPRDPGSATWAFKEINGATPFPYLAAEAAALEAAKITRYETIKGRSVTVGGWVDSGEWIDIIRGLAWLQARIQERLFSVFLTNEKVPYTDAGIALLSNPVDATLREAVRKTILTDDPVKPYTVIPRAADADPIDRANRVFPDIKFYGRLAGAIHKTAVVGTVTF